MVETNNAQSCLQIFGSRQHLQTFLAARVYCANPKSMKAMTFKLGDSLLARKPRLEHSANLFREIAKLKKGAKAHSTELRVKLQAQSAKLEKFLDAGPFATILCRDMTNRVVYNRCAKKIDGHLRLEVTNAQDRTVFLWDGRRKQVNEVVHGLNYGKALPLRYICNHLSRESAAFNDWLSTQGCPIPSTVDELMMLFTAMDSTQAKYITAEETVTLDIIQTRWDMFIDLPNTQCLIDPLSSDVEEVLQAHKDVAGWVKYVEGDSLETLIRKFVVFVHGRVYVQGDSVDESIKRLVDSSKKPSSRIFRAGTVLKKLVDGFEALQYPKPPAGERKRKLGQGCKRHVVGGRSKKRAKKRSSRV